MSLLTAFEKNYTFTKKEKDFLDILPVDVYEEIKNTSVRWKRTG